METFDGGFAFCDCIGCTVLSMYEEVADEVSSPTVTQVMTSRSVHGDLNACGTGTAAVLAANAVCGAGLGDPGASMSVTPLLLYDGRDVPDSCFSERSFDG